jgi:hypothetical protein
VHTQDNRLGTPRGVPTQEFASQGYTNQGFTTPDFANRNFSNRGFTIEDILWSLGIWSAIICLSPLIIFYMLMVA